VVTEICPKIEGAFRRELLAMVDSVLWTNAQRREVEVNAAGATKRETRVEYWVDTVPTDKFRRAGDGIGGGRYRTLPPRLEGTYQSLANAWGIHTPKEK
jgi:hypothetical protein